MAALLLALERSAPIMLSAAVIVASTMLAAVVIERAGYGVVRARNHRITRHYAPLVERALAGDDSACAALAVSPRRHRLAIAWLLIAPLISDRDPRRIAATRAIAETLEVLELADRYLRSWSWWRRALALRALGLMQARERTAQLIAALDNANADVRAAALDGLADMHDPVALKAIVVRVHDTSLHRGRRGAALKAFGSGCEPFLLELAEVDPVNRLNYIHALAICGTARSRPILCRWTGDARLDVRATAFEALAYVGLDDETARVVIDGLESDAPAVRAMAAYALCGWRGAGDAARCLAPHLDDTWPVAVRAARALQSMGDAGLAELRARADRPDLVGLLARQMLWQPVDRA
jgi:HEAT repeat protein